jgi:glycosyltransferase involved in cell wall biosynthesis
VYYSSSACDKTVEYSVVMPIHNQGAIIKRNLQALIDCTGGTYELILILDTCEDNTKSVVLEFVKGLAIARIVVVEAVDVPLFETICDNIGFRLATGKWLLEIQADMKMTQRDYNIRLSLPFLIYDNVIAVSGRCCHSLNQSEIIGRGGLDIELGVDALGLDRDIFYVHEVCNRGPLLLDAARAAALGYLDEMNYFLDYSEIDLVLRAYETHKWICGYVPIDFDSPIAEGSTRKPRDAVNTYIHNIRKQRCGGGFVATYFARGEFRKALHLPLHK